MVRGVAAFLKYSIFVFNFFVCISGMILIAVGTLLEVQQFGMVEMFGSEKFSLPIVIIGAGVVATAAGFLGCWGAIRESSVLLVVYGVIVFIIVIAEVAGGIYAFKQKEDLKVQLARNVIKNMMKYNKTGEGEDKAPTVIWNFVQQKFNCCGANNYTDWIYIKMLLMLRLQLPKNFNPLKDINAEYFLKQAGAKNKRDDKLSNVQKLEEIGPLQKLKEDSKKDPDKWLNEIGYNGELTKEVLEKLYKLAMELTTANPLLPRTCCFGISKKTQCVISAHMAPHFRTQGCLSKLKNWIEKKVKPLAAVAITIAVIEIAGIIVSCFVAYEIRDEEHKRSWYGTDSASSR